LKSLLSGIGNAVVTISGHLFDITRLLLKCATVIVVSIIIFAAIVCSQVVGSVSNFEFDKQHASAINSFVREIERPYVCYMSVYYVAFNEDTAGCAEKRDQNEAIYWEERAAEKRISKENRHKADMDVYFEDTYGDSMRRTSSLRGSVAATPAPVSTKGVR
jgi:hypothetical protein